jgi:hypothetical protein
MTKINFKNISTSGFDEDALTTTMSGKHVLNFGRLTTSGDLANGVFADANNASIGNFGRIETSGLGAAGIFAQGEHAHIENFGSVVTHGGVFDPDPSVEGDEIFSEGIFANGDGFHIANYGRVHVEGESSTALLGVGADGLVINYGRLESSSILSGIIDARGDRSVAINAGHLTGTGDFTIGLSADGEDAVVFNYGKIAITDAEGAIGVSGFGDNTHVTNKGIIDIASNDSFGILARLGEGLQVSNFGQIKTEGSFAVGIGSGGLDTQIVNAGHVTTEGNLAIGITLGVTRIGFVAAADGEIVNRGVIETEGDGAAGVVMIGDGHHLTNSGRITTDGGAFDSELLGPFRAAGVVVSGDDALVENTRSGVIRSEDAHSAAVELNIVERDGFPATEMSSRLDNFGLIMGAGVAVRGGAGQETVINHGRIVGDVVLGDGADTFVFGKGGNLAGDVFLGGGDDVVRIENGSGTSHIADFAAGAASGDVLDVSAFFSSFHDVQTHSRQHGNDVVITLDHDDQLVLGNVHLNALSAHDFLFV